MQKDMKDFVILQPAAGSLWRTWPSTRTAPITARRWRGGDRGGEAGTWLAAGRRRGACPVPRVSREALPGERLGLLLGAPRQQVAPGLVTESAGQGPCGDPAASEGERVLEGATAERQVRGAVDPAHPHGARGVGSLPACVGRRITRRTPRDAVGRPFCLLVRMRRPHQASCQIAGGLRRESEPQGSRCDERDGRKKWAVKAQKYWSHLAWMTAVRDQVAVVETDDMADLVLSQGGCTIANFVRYQYKVGNLGRRCSSPLAAQRCSNLVRGHVLPPATEDFDMVNAMTNLVVQAVRKMDLPFWLPSLEVSSWSDTPRRSVDGCRVSWARRRRRSS